MLEQIDHHTIYVYQLMKKMNYFDDPNSPGDILPSEVMNVPTEKTKIPLKVTRLQYVHDVGTPEEDVYHINIAMTDDEDKPGYTKSLSRRVLSIIFYWLSLEIFHFVRDRDVQFSTKQQAADMVREDRDGSV